MTTFRAAVALSLVVSLAACGTPPVRPDHLADRDKRRLGRIALLVDSKDPVYEFEASTKGKGEGAAKGAGEGAVASLQCGVLVILCLPLGLTIGAVMGASAAKPEGELASSNTGVQAEIRSLGVPEKLREALAVYAKRTGIQPAILKIESMPQTAEAKPDYAALAGVADSVAELRDFRLKAYTTGKEGAALVLAVSAHVRVIGTRDQQVLDDFVTTATPHARIPEEWLERGAAGLSESIRTSLDEIAETAVDEILLIYHPARMDPAREKVPGPAGIPVTAHTDPPSQNELVPGYALRTIQPPFRNKVYWDKTKMNMGHLELYRLADLQPVFEWEAFPRNYDLIPGSEQGQARDLHYDFRIYGRMGIEYERMGLDAPRHKIEVPLRPCERYRWTTRATFELNEARRVTEWTGGYATIGGAIGPWEWRRGKRTSLMWLLPNVTKYPIVTTPASNGGPCPDD